MWFVNDLVQHFSATSYLSLKSVVVGIKKKNKFCSLKRPRKALQVEISKCCFWGSFTKEGHHWTTIPFGSLPALQCDVIATILLSTFFLLTKIATSVVPHILNPATCVAFAVNYTQACATCAFFIFGKLKIWAWSPHTITKTGLGSRFCRRWTYRSKTLQGRQVSGWQCLRQVCCGGSRCSKTGEAGRSVHQLHLREGNCQKLFVLTRSWLFWLPRHFDQLLNAPHFFRLELLFSPSQKLNQFIQCTDNSSACRRTQKKKKKVNKWLF